MLGFNSVGTRAKISLSACSNTKYFQRPASSNLSKNATSLQGICPADMARSRQRRVSRTCPHNLLYAQFGNVTKPLGWLAESVFGLIAKMSLHFRIQKARPWLTGLGTSPHSKTAMISISDGCLNGNFCYMLGFIDDQSLHRVG